MSDESESSRNDAERPAPECREKGYCCGPNAFVAVCDCYDAIWAGEKWWEPRRPTDTPGRTG